MIRRTFLGAVAFATSGLVTAPLVAHTAPAFTTPTTTTTTTSPELAAPSTTSTTTTTTTTTTTSPEFAAPTTSTTTTTTEPDLSAPTTPPTTPASEPALATPTTAPTTPASEPELAAPTTPPSTLPDADQPIGEVDTSGAVPDGLDLSVVPGVDEGGDTAGGDGPVLTDQPTCANMCIRSGLMYPRGFGAELVVKTYLDARLFISVVDSDNELVDVVNTDLVTSYSWALDHLDPGETYYVVVAATDDNDETSHAFGEFETRSRREVTVTVGEPFVTVGPSNLIGYSEFLWVNDFGFVSTDPDTPIWYYSLPRQADVAVTVFYSWSTSQYTLCEGWGPVDSTVQGDSDAACGTFNSAGHQIDLDQIPSGKSRWTSVEFTHLLDTATDAALPPDYGDPRYLGFQVNVTFTVEYH